MRTFRKIAVEPLAWVGLLALTFGISAYTNTAGTPRPRWDPSNPPAANSLLYVDTNTALRSTGCTVDPADPSLPVCPAPLNTSKGFAGCEPSSKGNDCATWAPDASLADPLTSSPVHTIYPDGKIPGASVREARSVVSLSTGLCGVSISCGAGDHVPFVQKKFENDTDVIECDITTTYTTALDAPSLGRCTLKEAGIYEIRGTLDGTFTNGGGSINMVARRVQTGKEFVIGAYGRIFPHNSTGASEFVFSAGESWGFFTLSDPPALIELRFFTATNLNIIETGMFDIRRIE